MTIKEVQPITPMKTTYGFHCGRRTRDSRFFDNDKLAVVDTFEIKGQPKKVHIKVYKDPFDLKPEKEKWKVHKDEK